jgi:hypothetical protein
MHRCTSGPVPALSDARRRYSGEVEWCKLPPKVALASTSDLFGAHPDRVIRGPGTIQG